MTWYRCTTQAELDAALAKATGGDVVVCTGSGAFRVTGSSTVRAYDSSTVRAYDSSTVWASGSSTVSAYDSSTVRATDSSTVRATGSSTVRATDSSTVWAYGSSTVSASRYVVVRVDRQGRGARPSVAGGVLIEVPPITTAAGWCEYRGVDVVDGRVTLYKAVDDDYATDHARKSGIAYRPGTTVEAPDWDPEPECGGGLHFCASPAEAWSFRPDATRYVACVVRLDEIVVHHPAGHPSKVKAPRIVAPIIEVDIDGEPLAVQS